MKKKNRKTSIFDYKQARKKMVGTVTLFIKQNKKIGSSRHRETS